MYYYTSHDYSEAKDFISSCLSCCAWHVVSQSIDLQIGSRGTNSQKSIQSWTDFNSTKSHLIRILSFARFQPKLSSYICGWCGRLSAKNNQFKIDTFLTFTRAPNQEGDTGIVKHLKIAPENSRKIQLYDQITKFKNNYQ